MKWARFFRGLGGGEEQKIPPHSVRLPSLLPLFHSCLLFRHSLSFYGVPFSREVTELYQALVLGFRVKEELSCVLFCAIALLKHATYST